MVAGPVLSDDNQRLGSKGYEIGLCVRLSRCVWISGPFRCGKHDVTIFKGIEDEHDERFRESLDLPPYEECLQDKIAEGKLCIFDAGYRGGKRLALPSACDPKELHNFKSRARCRHDSRSMDGSRIFSFCRTLISSASRSIALLLRQCASSYSTKWTKAPNFLSSRF